MRKERGDGVRWGRRGEERGEEGTRKVMRMRRG
jgi:hypothetical protein